MQIDLSKRVEELLHITFRDMQPLLLPQSLSKFRSERNEFLILNTKTPNLKPTAIHYWNIEVQVFINALNEMNKSFKPTGDFLNIDPNNMYHINQYRHSTIVGFLPLNQVFYSEYLRLLPTPQWSL